MKAVAKKRGGNAKVKASSPAPLPTADETLAVLPDARRAELAARMERKAARPIRPAISVKMKSGPSGKATASVSMVDDEKLPDPAANFAQKALTVYRLFDACGTESQAFSDIIINRLINAVRVKGEEVNERDVNAALAALASIEPRNEMEALLGVQMIEADSGARRCFQMMTRADYAERFDALGNLANKFMRTHVAQVEALAKLRRGGEQVVRHIHVNAGGQAVIADTINQNRGGGGEREDAEQSHAAGAIAGCSSMPSPKP